MNINQIMNQLSQVKIKTSKQNLAVKLDKKNKTKQNNFTDKKIKFDNKKVTYNNSAMSPESQIIISNTICTVILHRLDRLPSDSFSIAQFLQ